MARKTKKSTPVTINEIETPAIPLTATRTPRFSFFSARFIKIVLAVIVLGVIVTLLARRYMGNLVAATVNGAPVLRRDLTKRLTDRFGTQMLEAMIGEQLINAEAVKRQIAVTDAEVNAKVTEVSKAYTGSMSLEDTLKLQGITKSEFENQVRIQLLIDKMFTKGIAVSASETAAYIKDNASTLTATTDAERQVQAEKEVQAQKESQIFIEWFNKAKQDAKINRYL